MSRSTVDSGSAAQKTYYEICGSQALPLLQLRYSPHKECTQIIFYMIVNQKLDFELLERAVNMEIERNDSLRIRFEKQDKKLKQYFLPELKLENIPILDFTGKTKQEQDAVLSKDAHKPLKIMKGETYRIIFYQTFDGRTGIYLNISHIIADLSAAVVFFSDLLEVITALQNGATMPKPLSSFEECLKKDLLAFNDKEATEKHHQFFKELFTKDGPTFYAGVDGMRLLNKTRRKKKDPNLRYETRSMLMSDKSENYSIHLPAERAEPLTAESPLRTSAPGAAVSTRSPFAPLSPRIKRLWKQSRIRSRCSSKSCAIRIICSNSPKMGLKLGKTGRFSQEPTPCSFLVSHFPLRCPRTGSARLATTATAASQCRCILWWFPTLSRVVLISTSSIW